MTRSKRGKELRPSISSNDAFYPEPRCICKEKTVKILELSIKLPYIVHLDLYLSFLMLDNHTVAVRACVLDD